MKSTQLFDYPIHLVTAEEGLAAITQAAGNIHVVTLNPEMIMQGDADPELGEILRRAGLVIPDGAGVVWALKRKRHPIKRLPGIEFSEAVLNWAAKNQQPIGIIGARQDVLDLAMENLKTRFPGLSIAYARNGFFDNPADIEAAAKACAETNPRVVLVAMGVPRQEKWIAQYSHLFQNTILIGVGGSLDVWSGQTQRAPGWMRTLNLEWLYRITSEPWRIQRIYKTLPMFVVKVLLSRA